MKPNNLKPAFLEIIKDAARAPSGHNTQPWKFKVTENQIIIIPDFTRRLKVVDTDDHALYISLGCALENLILSAKSHGFSTTVSLNFSDSDNEIIVALKNSENIQKDILYDFIPQRQSTRTEYNPAPIEQSILEQLIEQSKNECVDVIFITNKSQIKELEPFILEASDLQFRNKQFIKELVSWIRFSKREAEKKGDGVWSASMGFPKTGRFLGGIIMRYLVSSKSEEKRWKNLIEKSGGFALFISKKNSKRNWIRLGQSFQRFALKATQLNLKHAHVNMPCEEISVRHKLIQYFKIDNGRQPLLLVRFGYAETLPYSFRLPVEQILCANEIIDK